MYGQRLSGRKHRVLRVTYVGGDMLFLEPPLFQDG
jgi:hypothetical protein